MGYKRSKSIFFVIGVALFILILSDYCRITFFGASLKSLAWSQERSVVNNSEVNQNLVKELIEENKRLSVLLDKKTNNSSLPSENQPALQNITELQNFFEKRINSLIGERSAALKENQQLQQELRSLKKRLEVFNERFNEKKDEISSLEKNVTEKDQIIMNLISEKDLVSFALSKEKQEKTMLEDEIASLKEEFKSLQAPLVQKIKEATSPLEKQIAFFQEMHKSEKEEIISQKRAIEGELLQSQNSLGQAEKLLGEQQAINKNLEIIIKEKESDVKAKLALIDDIEKDKDLLEKENLKLISEITEIKLKNSEQTSEILLLKSNISDLMKANTSKELFVANLMKDKNQAAGDLSLARADLIRLKTEIDSKDIRFSKLNSENQALTAELSKIKIDSDALKDSITASEKINQGLINEKTSLSAAVNRSQDEILQLRKIIEEKDLNLKYLEENASVLKNKVKELSAALDDQNEQFSKVKNSLEQVEKKHNDRFSSKEDKLKAEVSQLKKENDNLKQAILRKDKGLSDIKREIRKAKALCLFPEED